MQQDRQSPSDTFITQWERGREAPPAAELLETPQVVEHVAIPWKWGWSPWIGITYGPVPVGLIIGIPLLFALWR